MVRVVIARKARSHRRAPTARPNLISSATIRPMYRALLLALVFVASATFAGPYIPAGDLMLRHDIQRLADHGIIKGPTSTWPLAWGPILDDIRTADAVNLPPDVADALARVSQRADWETRDSRAGPSMPRQASPTTRPAFARFKTHPEARSRSARARAGSTNGSALISMCRASIPTRTAKNSGPTTA